MQPLIAIPGDAPSVPAPLRLYHGGCAKNGRLLPQAPRHILYFGPYVFLSAAKDYAQRYVAKQRTVHAARRLRAARLYTVDARQLPAGSRILVMRTDEPCLEAYLCDLIDLQMELSIWLELLDDEGVGSTYELAEFAAPGRRSGRCGPRERLHRLAEATVCISDAPQPFATFAPARTIALLHQAQRVWQASRLTQVLRPAELAAHHGADIKHPFRDAVLHMLGRCGSLNVRRAQLEQAIAELPDLWLHSFSIPFDLASFAAQRERAQMRRVHARHDGERRTGDSDAVIVLVPGPIPTLPVRQAAQPPRPIGRALAPRLNESL